MPDVLSDVVQSGLEKTERSRSRTQRALVEPLQLRRACRPAEASLGERAGSSAEAQPQIVVIEEALDGLRDLERVAAV